MGNGVKGFTKASSCVSCFLDVEAGKEEKVITTSWKVSLPAEPADRRVARRAAEGLGDFVCCYISSAALVKDIFICLVWVLGAVLSLSSDCVRSPK